MIASKAKVRLIASTSVKIILYYILDEGVIGFEDLIE
jgi:hypothetical protein